MGTNYLTNMKTRFITLSLTFVSLFFLFFGHVNKLHS